MITVKFECACPGGPFTKLEYKDRPGEGDQKIFYAECGGCGAQWEKSSGTMGIGGQWTRVRPPQRNPDGTPYEEPKPRQAEPVRPEGQPVPPAEIEAERVDDQKEQADSFEEKMIGAVAERLGPEARDLVSKMTGRSFPVAGPGAPSDPESEKPTAGAATGACEDDDLFSDLAWQELNTKRESAPKIASPAEGAFLLRATLDRYSDWAKTQPDDVCPMRLLAAVAAESQRIAEDLGWTEIEEGSDEETD